MVGSLSWSSKTDKGRKRALCCEQRSLQKAHSVVETSHAKWLAAQLILLFTMEPCLHPSLKANGSYWQLELLNGVQGNRVLEA